MCVHVRTHAVSPMERTLTHFGTKDVIDNSTANSFYIQLGHHSAIHDLDIIYKNILALDLNKRIV